MDEFLTTSSDWPVHDTVDRLEACAKARGMTVFARIDHALGAASAGIPLAPMQLLILGNPKAGTPLIQACPQIGIDLPLHVLVWENQMKTVVISAINPEFIAERRGATGNAIRQSARAMSAALVQLMRSIDPSSREHRDPIGA